MTRSRECDVRVNHIAECDVRVNHIAEYLFTYCVQHSAAI